MFKFVAACSLKQKPNDQWHFFKMAFQQVKREKDYHNIVLSQKEKSKNFFVTYFSEFQNFLGKNEQL